MVPVAFEYHRAGSVAEALSLMAQHGEDAKILAGGHSMVPAMKLRLSTPTTVIDLGGVSELKYITDKGLKHPENGRQIVLDDTLRALLKPPADVQITYLNVQKFLSPHYIKVEA